MGKIQILEQSVADLIAAGEVVERPASVVKELLENAIDAKASRVTVEIRGGGISFIRVSDDGEGMEKDEVEVAFLRHATSKIRSKDDLAAIRTLGFRGEALAAIAAVSKIDVMTATKNSPIGHHAHLEGGKLLSVEEAGCPKGTTVLVRDVYYNTPARMKFMKKDSTEAGYIQEITERIALSHPDVCVQFIRDGSAIFTTLGNGELLGAVYAIFGGEIADSLVPCTYTYEGIAVNGLVGRPYTARHNRTWQCFFLNGRFMKSKTFFAAMDEAYRDAVMTKRYPSVFLHIEIDPEMVDINVHPAKLEAKFGKEKLVYDALYFAVMTALGIDVQRPLADKVVKPLWPVKADEVPAPESAMDEGQQQYFGINLGVGGNGGQPVILGADEDAMPLKSSAFFTPADAWGAMQMAAQGPVEKPITPEERERAAAAF